MSESSKPSRGGRRRPAPTTPDPIEIAMEAEASGEAPERDSPAWRVLIRQEQLLGWQILKERAGFGLRVLTGVVGVIAALLIGSLIWSATQERGLVIESFSVPPEFEARGITGQVLASRLLDELSRMTDQTVSVRNPSTYANNWNGDIKVQIPQTGVSVGELRRYLVDWLGHQTTIGGELYRSGDGLVLAARSGTAAAVPQTGAGEADLDQMIRKAAEEVYAVTQPYRYAIYLGRTGDQAGKARSRALLLDLSQRGDKADRMWAFAALALTDQDLGDFDAAIAATNQSLAIDPTFNLAYANRAGSEMGLGMVEAAYEDSLKAAEMARRYGPRHMRADSLDFVRGQWSANLALGSGDLLGVETGMAQAQRARPGDPRITGLRVQSLAGLHQPSDATRSLQALPASTIPEDMAGQIDLEIAVALARDEGAAALALDRSLSDAGLAPGTVASRRMTRLFNLAPVMAAAGQADAARALVADFSPRCQPCFLGRAGVHEALGERPAADAAFAHAAAMAPSLPHSHQLWGEAKLARGDAAGALAQFRLANRIGPRWADPLKGWADALMAQGDARGAERKYAEAAERAPRWGALHLAWGRALEALGRGADARIRYRAAADMDLSPADRAALNARLARP